MPEESRKTYRQKRNEYNNYDEDNGANILNDKDYQTSSLKFRQMIFSFQQGH